MLAIWGINLNIWINILIFFTTVFLFIYAYFKYSFTYWARKGVPYLPPSFPLGNNQVLGREAITFGVESQEWYNAFKQMKVKFGGVYNFSNKVLVLVDTELIKDILTKDFNYFMNRDFFHNPEYEPRSNNLFVVENEDWRYKRQKLTPAFTSAKMKYMFECVLKCSDLLVDLFGQAVQSQTDIFLKRILDQFTMDNIGVVAFGLNFNCLLSEDNKFRYIADVINRPNIVNQIKRVAVRVAPTLCRKMGVIVQDKEFSDFFANMVVDNVEHRRKNDIRRNDFTQLLMDIQDDSVQDDIAFSIEDIIANCILFFFAGFDTSSKTMQYTIFELSRNQEVQDKVRKDIKKVLDKYNGNLTYEGLQEMTYLHQVVNETLRLYPPVLTLTRVCQKDYKLNSSDLVIEKGTTVVISAIGLHRDPDLFPNPEKYDPDRFSPSNKSKIVPYSYLPFGEGPRNCIGRRFGSMQTAIGLVRVLSNYKFDVSPKMKFPLHIKQGQFVLNTEDLYVRATKI